ncbi:MAG: transporter substrate-binding domain-containing protein, partial [Marinobacterium sp.]
MKTVLRGLMTGVLGLLALAAGSSPVWSAEPTSIRVGVFANPPKLVLDQQLEISGIYGDLLRAIAREEGWHLEPVACHWAQCLDWLQQGQLDLL